jgi:hypothetical protein
MQFWGGLDDSKRGQSISIVLLIRICINSPVFDFFPSTPATCKSTQLPKKTDFLFMFRVTLQNAAPNFVS